VERVKKTYKETTRNSLRLCHESNQWPLDHQEVLVKKETKASARGPKLVVEFAARRFNYNWLVYKLRLNMDLTCLKLTKHTLFLNQSAFFSHVATIPLLNLSLVNGVTCSYNFGVPTSTSKFNLHSTCFSIHSTESYTVQSRFSKSRLFENQFIQVDALQSRLLLCWVQNSVEMHISVSFRHYYTSFQPFPLSILV